jgi:hypothetical protein
MLLQKLKSLFSEEISNVFSATYSTKDERSEKKSRRNEAGERNFRYIDWRRIMDSGLLLEMADIIILNLCADDLSVEDYGVLLVDILRMLRSEGPDLMRFIPEMFN